MSLPVLLSGRFRSLFVLIAICFACNGIVLAQKSPSSEADLKKQAEKRFNSVDYVNALPFYSQLLSLYPRNPEYNYRYGVCLLQSSKDKAAAVSYLENASRSPKTDEEVYFYLGKSYMLTNNFPGALQAFENFKKRAGAGKSKKMDVDLLIGNCKSANELMKNRRNVVIINQQQVIRNSFYGAYIMDSSCGKMLTTPERFLTSRDKDKIANPLMFLTIDGQVIYYASYGKSGEKGKDIYRITKQGNGTWGEAESLGSIINTDQDEDYPFLDRDGKTFYFCSKGHNSIGGYDIFKSVFDFASNEWSQPENVGIPINTPDDDIFYVPNVTGDYAQYACAIESDLGRIGVRKIKLGDVLNHLAVISGQYYSEDQPQRRDAKISVIRIKDNGLVTTVRTDPRSGKYELNIPPGDDYTLVVEAGGYLAHAENFSLADGLSLADLKQKVQLGKTAEAESMTLSNYFTVSKKSSGESLATVSTDPTNVISNEYRLRDTDTSKLQPIDIKGRIVYVTPPKNVVAIKSGMQPHALFEQNAEPVAVNDQKKNSPDKTTEIKSQGTEAKPEEMKVETGVAAKQDQMVAQNQETEKENSAPKVNERELKTSQEAPAKKIKEEKNSSAKNIVEVKNTPEVHAGKSEPAKASSHEEHASVISKKDETADADDHSIAAQKENEQPAAESKKDLAEGKKIPGNVSNKQLVKIAYEDARTQKAEAQSFADNAEMTKQLAQEQDSVSKSQIKEARQLLKEGGPENKEKAKLLLKESEENDKMASARFKKAKELEAEAKQLNSEADESAHEADVLMKIAQADSAKTASVKEKNHGAQKTKANPGVNKSQPAKTEDHELIASVEKPKDIDQQTEKIQPAQNENTVQGKQPETKAETPVASDSHGWADSQTRAESYSSSQPVNKDIKDNKERQDAVPLKEEASVENSSTSSTVTLGTASAPDPGKANQPYLEHRKMLNESKELAAKADEIQRRIDEMPSSHHRDSLIASANEMNTLSIKKWQQAQEKLNEAKWNDPQVETKMKDVEVTHENGESQQTNLSQAKQNQTSDQIKSSANRNVVASNTNINKASPVKAVTIEHTNVADETPVDTTSPLYPEYAATTTQIKTKQTETIDVFAEAIKLNKLAQEKKEEEISIRDKAVALTDSKQKSQELKKADALKQQADSLSASSVTKFKTAQHITGEVAMLNDKAGKLKIKMNSSVPQKQNESTASVAVSKTPPQNIPAKADSKTTQQNPEPKADLKVVQQNTVDKPLHEEEKNKSTSADIPIPQPEKKVAGSEIVSEVKIEKTDSPSPVKTETSYTGNTTAKITQPKSTAEVKEKNVSWLKYEPSVIQPDMADAHVVQHASKTENIEKTIVTDKPIEKKLLADATPLSRKMKLPFMNEPSNFSEETIFSVSSNPYNDTHPIPIDAKLPEGLVFKVQIGAFHSPLPQNTFKNLQPVTGETTRPGWIRYCVGLFKAFEAANLLKSEMKTIGYKDAFVVAYYNGKRIQLSEAYALINKSGTEEKKLYASNIKTETSHLRALNITAPKLNDPKDADMNSFYGTSMDESSKENSGFIEYAVQVGVYKTSRVPNALVSLIPLHPEQTRKGLYRFMTGRYSLLASADSSKRVAVHTGVRDAFIVAYKNGKQIAVNQSRLSSKKEAVAENTSKAPAQLVKITSEVSANQATGDVIYKIQLGAFRQPLSEAAINNFKKIASAEISRETRPSGLSILYAGSFTNLNTALSVKNEIVSRGIKDAFVAAFLNGKKVPVIKAGLRAKK